MTLSSEIKGETAAMQTTPPGVLYKGRLWRAGAFPGQMGESQNLAGGGGVLGLESR